MSTDIEKLTSALTEFVRESSVRAAIFESNQDHLTQAVTKMTLSHEKMLVSNNKLENKIVSLETKALDKLDFLDKTIKIIDDKTDLISSRVQVLEIINANTEGMVKGVSKYEHRQLNNWQKAVGLCSLLVAIATVAFAVISN